MSAVPSNNVFSTLEKVSLDHIADTYGTPCYVYSKAEILRAYNDYTSALGDHPGSVCYAVKANSNLAVLQILAEAGAHFDIVSIGELERVLRAGGRPDRVIFSGVGKTKPEMQRALELGIACFNVESEAELYELSQIANALNIPANISLRVNPDVDANTHPYISTGLKENKFGVAIDDAPRIYQIANQLPAINIVGVDCHIGSQLTEFSPFLDALDRLLLLIDTLKEQGIHIKHLDLGGGVGVVYKDETPPNIGEYIAKVKEKIAGRDLPLQFEPGRSIVANAGVLLTEVLYLKPGEEKNFAIVDAAMNDNLRPSLYSAWQAIRPLQESDVENKVWDVVGPICETGDFIGKDRELAISKGDRLALMSSGAYGFVMASNYNTRGRAAEVMVDGEHHFLIRERETFEDLIRGEKLLPTQQGQ
ncbi:MAG: diaminopimelate decarboxylase [Agarilytica sp.]